MSCRFAFAVANFPLSLQASDLRGIFWQFEFDRKTSERSWGSKLAVYRQGDPVICIR